MERILSKLSRECALPIPNPWQHFEVEHDDVQKMVSSQETRETASKRRLRELRDLIGEGIDVVHLNRWQARIGPLHIWVAAGRWMNNATGVRGKLNSTPIRRLLTLEVPDIVSGLPGF